jgi:4'-phosphopantetheinyl transferase
VSVLAHSWPDENPVTNPPRLSDASVHVWCCSLDDPPLSHEQLLGVLTADERDRSERYVFTRDSVRSVASRGLLRWLLGAQLSVRPREVNLGIGQWGKPELARQHESSGLSFNLAHSDEMVVFALTLHHEIGVDLERLRPMPEATDVATRFFARAEVEALRALPAERVEEAFFVGWTRKEAYVKARGVGLALPLDEFEVRLDVGPGSGQLSIPADPTQAAHWSLYDLRPARDLLGSVAVSGQRLRLRCRQWIG